jgi:hypothetical protein
MTDQMMERVVTALGHDDECAGDCTALSPQCDIWLGLAVMLDAAMPLVDSLKTLDALPVRSRLIGSDGHVWEYLGVVRGASSLARMGGGLAYSRATLKRGPLRVIWTPEAPK